MDSILSWLENQWNTEIPSSDLWGIGIAVLMGVAIAIVLLALATPLFIDSLVNEPGATKERFHLFTYLEEGQAKVIVRGRRLIRIIMAYAGNGFTREGDKLGPKYWEIKELGAGGKPVRLFGGNILNPITWWAHYVYWLTGAIFTGIYPWQKVRQYRLDQLKVLRDPTTTLTTIKVDQGRLSDHLRVRQFIWNVKVDEADTKDRISVRFLVAIRARVTNPHRAAFGTDRWDEQLGNLVTGTLSRFSRERPLDEVLSIPTGPAPAGGSGSAAKDALSIAVCAIEDDTEKFGLQIEDVDPLDISPNLSEAEQKQLYAGALAKPLAEASRRQGIVNAQNVRNMRNATLGGAHPELALSVLQADALVRAAAAAPTGIIIVPAGSTTSGLDAAQLAELRRLREEKAKTGGGTP